MNVERLIMGFGRRIMRRLFRQGINKGIDYAARRGVDPEQETAADRKRAKSAKEMVKKARKSAKLLRRL